MFASLPGFLLASLIIELTPGPNMVTLAVVSAMRGRRYGFAMVAGVAMGLALVGVAAAFGLAALLAASPVAWEVLRWGGGAFLLYIAWDGWQNAANGAGDAAGREDSPLGFFGMGLLINVLNPKAAIFYVGVLPSFLPQPGLVPFLALTAIYVGIATLVHALIVVFAGSAERLMVEQPERARRIRQALSLLIVVVAVWLVVATARG